MEKILTVVFFMCGLSAGIISASAESVEEQLPVENGIISPEVAKITAELFIRDARMALPELDWVEDTQVDNIVTMYDENGDISAYSCELVTNDSQSGYIVIAAYADSASDILEFSDEVQPVYYELDDSLKTKFHIIYTENMNYFLI